MWLWYSRSTEMAMAVAVEILFVERAVTAMPGAEKVRRL
jgi:hypothetical protein